METRPRLDVERHPVIVPAFTNAIFDNGNYYTGKEQPGANVEFKTRTDGQRIRRTNRPIHSLCSYKVNKQGPVKRLARR